VGIPNAEQQQQPVATDIKAAHCKNSMATDAQLLCVVHDGTGSVALELSRWAL